MGLLKKLRWSMLLSYKNSSTFVSLNLKNLRMRDMKWSKMIRILKKKYKV